MILTFWFCTEKEEEIVEVNFSEDLIENAQYSPDATLDEETEGNFHFKELLIELFQKDTCLIIKTEDLGQKSNDNYDNFKLTITLLPQQELWHIGTGALAAVYGIGMWMLISRCCGKKVHILENIKK